MNKWRQDLVGDHELILSHTKEAESAINHARLKEEECAMLGLLFQMGVPLKGIELSRDAEGGLYADLDGVRFYSPGSQTIGVMLMCQFCGARLASGEITAGRRELARFLQPPIPVCRHCGEQ